MGAGWVTTRGKDLLCALWRAVSDSMREEELLSSGACPKPGVIYMRVDAMALTAVRSVDKMLVHVPDVLKTRRYVWLPCRSAERPSTSFRKACSRRRTASTPSVAAG